MNAIVDALDRAYGVRDIDMPATPQRVFEIVTKAKLAAAA
jgi:carbon-monoxide dehydrogenase large subunit